MMNTERADVPTPSILGAAAVACAGLAVAFQIISSRRAERYAALTAYLRDHLGGADAAIHVVERLRAAHAGTRAGDLFAELHDEFRNDRAAVQALLKALGSSPFSIKRAAGKVTGGMLQTVAGGSEGDLSLFRTVEFLAIGVQGKRLLWRVLDRLPQARVLDIDFHALEDRAVDQWFRIERFRDSIADATFAGASE